MGRLLLLIGLVVAAAWLVRRIYLTGSSSSAEQGTNDATPALMKKCEHCNLHVPETRGVKNAQGVFFCSKEHLSQHSPQ